MSDRVGTRSGSIGCGQREPELLGECRHVLPIVVAWLEVRVERQLQFGCRAVDLPAGDLPVGLKAACRVVEHLPGQPGLYAGPGRAPLYGTTPLFLEKIGLGSVSELPPLASFAPDAQAAADIERALAPRPVTDEAAGEALSLEE